jgi:hypothetical protein
LLSLDLWWGQVASTALNGLRAQKLPADLPARLSESQVYVSVRGDSIRVSPHLYTTPADIERLVATLANALDAGGGTLRCRAAFSWGSRRRCCGA